MHMLRHVLGRVGYVNVDDNLRHMHMLRHVLGRVGYVNVHVNLRHMHMLLQKHLT